MCGCLYVKDKYEYFRVFLINGLLIVFITLFCLKRCYIFMLVKFVLTGNIKFSDGQAVRRLRVILLATGASGSSVFSGAMSGGGALSFSTLLEKFLSASDGPRD